MKSFDVQSIDLNASCSQAFAYIANPEHLPAWTNAFASVIPGRALMRTPTGEVMIDLEVQASSDLGTVDWCMRFPDRSVAKAFSRVVALAPDRCVFSFVLTPPPVPLEQLEGALEAQSRTLAEELEKLKHNIERHD